MAVDSPFWPYSALVSRRSTIRRRRRLTEWVPLLEAAKSADREMRGTFLEVCAKEHGSGSRSRFLEYFATLLNKYGSVYGTSGATVTALIRAGWPIAHQRAIKHIPCCLKAVAER